MEAACILTPRTFLQERVDRLNRYLAELSLEARTLAIRMRPSRAIGQLCGPRPRRSENEDDQDRHRRQRSKKLEQSRFVIRKSCKNSEKF